MKSYATDGMIRCAGFIKNAWWVRVALATGWFTLAACATQAPVPADGASQCRAEPAQWAVGQVISDSLVNRIQVESGASVVRRLRPGQPMTRDFRHDRVNVEIDNAGRIQTIACG